MGVVDLERYDFTKGSQSLIRATEGTVLERIPPRVKVREHAALECPHIMLLIDDPMKTVIEPVEDRMAELESVYQFDLMQDSGSLEGILCDDSEARRILAALMSWVIQRHLMRGTNSQEKLLCFCSRRRQSLLGNSKDLL